MTDIAESKLDITGIEEAFLAYRPMPAHQPPLGKTFSRSYFLETIALKIMDLKIMDLETMDLKTMAPETQSALTPSL